MNLTVKSSKLDGLGNTASEKNSATVPDKYFFIRFWTISRWTWRQFRGGHSKRGVWLFGMFFLPSSHICQGLKRLLTPVQAKKGSWQKKNNSFGVQEGAVTTSGE
jgi:hypothetical protein